MSYKHDIDEAVVVTQSDGPMGGFDYKHPSYGLASVCRSQGDTNLFGSDLNHNSFITLRIDEADVRQDLGRSWYHDTKRIIEARMSSVQYAEMISNPNTQGVPCTISYRQGHGTIKYRPPMDEIDNVKREMEESFDDVKEKQKDVLDKVKEIFQKGSVGKGDRETILKMISNLSTDITSSIPFYQEQAEKILGRRVMSAKSEVEGYVLHVQNRVGKHVMENPDLLRLMVGEYKQSDEGV